MPTLRLRACAAPTCEAVVVTTASKVVVDAEALQRTLVRIAHEILERNPEAGELCLVGIYTRGVAARAAAAPRARRRRAAATCRSARSTSRFYRDDLGRRGAGRVVHATRLDFDIDGRTVVLVDDVLYTGRTIRAAIDALFDIGRPARIQLAVLADRGHRELPIRADYVGKNLPTSQRRAHLRARRRGGRGRRDRDRRQLMGELSYPPREPGARRHLISIDDLDRDGIERILDVAASFESVVAREVKKVPTLRGRTVVNVFFEAVDAHVVVVRARREAALGRHDVAQGVRLERRQGRVAEGHDPDALGVRRRTSS